MAVKKLRVIFPIGAKLIIIFTLMLFFSLGTIITLVWFFVSRDIEKTAWDNNRNTAVQAAGAAQTMIDTVYTNTSVFLYNYLLTQTDEQPLSFFKRNPDIAAVMSETQIFCNKDFFTANEINVQLLDSYLLYNKNTPTIISNNARITNAAAYFGGIPILSLVFNISINNNYSTVTVLFQTQELIESFGSGANSSILINESGGLLISSDMEALRTEENVFHKRYCREAFSRNTMNKNFDGLFVSSIQLESASCAVITTISSDIVFEGIVTTTRRNIYLTAGVWFLAILFVWFLARNLSLPISLLQRAAEEIENGNYRLDMLNNNKAANGKDETGVLTLSVISMSTVLENFEKLTNKVIARLARQGKLVTGGSEKYTTVFFSDIRSFTAISERLKPEEVISFLNAYMEKMVACVLLTGGTIDKFVGDAIMAHWGAVETTGTQQSDALAACRAGLMMRACLRNFNKDRGTNEKTPVIKIGCALNSGMVVAGQIGCDERLEYTIIGGTVSLADRTEVFNKSFGTEFLITEHTWNFVKDYIIAEEMPSITQDNKTVRMFAVINMSDKTETEKILQDLKKINGLLDDVCAECVGPLGPRTLNDLRIMLDIQAADLAKINTNEEEKKFKITTPA